MDWITTLDHLHAHYGQPGKPATVKVTGQLTSACRTFLERSRFCILATVGPEGTDSSPRGEEGPVVTILDPGTLALPVWKGRRSPLAMRGALIRSALWTSGDQSAGLPTVGDMLHEITGGRHRRAGLRCRLARPRGADDVVTQARGQSFPAGKCPQASH